MNSIDSAAQQQLGAAMEELFDGRLRSETALAIAKALFESGKFDAASPRRPGEMPFFASMALRPRAGSCASSPEFLDALAQLSRQSPAELWSSQANGIPLACAMLEGFLEHGNPVNFENLAKAIAAADPAKLASWRGSSRRIDAKGWGFMQAFLCAGLHSREPADPAGYACALAALESKGLRIAGAKGAEGYPLARLIAASCAFDSALAQGEDFSAPVPDSEGNPAPLWEHLRSRARSLGKTELLAKVEAWAKAHSGGAVEAKEIEEYFASLDRYGEAGKALRSRPDWAQVTDSAGRTAMMRLVASRAANVKEFWETKKALANLAKKDNAGRSIWHYALLTGKDAPRGTAQTLLRHCPLEPDKAGLGAVPAAIRLAGKRFNEHPFLFAPDALKKAAEAYPSAASWFGTQTAEDAEFFASKLTVDRYWPRHAVSSFCEKIAALTLMLDPASYAALDGKVQGALWFNLACFARYRNPQGDSPSDPLLEAMPSLPGFSFECSAELKAAMEPTFGADGAGKLIAELESRLIATAPSGATRKGSSASL